MTERSLVNKVIALLSFGQTQVVVSFRFDVQTTQLLKQGMTYNDLQ